MKVQSIGSNQIEVQCDNGVRVLVSYSTPVAYYHKGLYYKSDCSWSRTTSKHVNNWAIGETKWVSQEKVQRVLDSNGKCLE